MTVHPLSGINPRPCLVLLCKRPALGHSKQRLAEQLGVEPALRVAQLLLACAVEDLEQWPGPRVLAPDHIRHREWGQAVCPQAQCVPQHDGNLGERLNDLDARLRRQGHHQLIYIGSDCPALRPRDYRKVARLLQISDTVLMMAQDGGVVLMASNRPWPTLDALPWSTKDLGDALVACCRRAGHEVLLAGELFDIDRRKDLQPLAETLATDPRPMRRQLCAALGDLLEPSHA